MLSQQCPEAVADLGVVVLWSGVPAHKRDPELGGPALRATVAHQLGVQAFAPVSHKGSEATWNPVTGCSEVSPGCAHCYAKTFAERWRGVPGYPERPGPSL